MTSRYRILVQTTFLHDYFAHGRCEYFNIRPSVETVALLAGYRLLVRVAGNRLVILTKVDELGRPAAAILSARKLVFYLDLNNSEFLVVTNLDTALRSGRLYFSNLNQNLAGPSSTQVLDLTRDIDVF